MSKDNISHESYMEGYRNGKREIIHKIQSFLSSEEGEIE